MKLHTYGRVQHGASTDIDGDYFYFKEGSTGVIKILEPMNPLLNYYEYLIVSRGQEVFVGIGVRMPIRGTLLYALPQGLAHLTLVASVIMQLYLLTHSWCIRTHPHTTPHVHTPLCHTHTTTSPLTYRWGSVPIP